MNNKNYNNNYSNYYHHRNDRDNSHNERSNLHSPINISNKVKFSSRKLATWQCLEDVKFSKKISERFDPSELGDNPNIKIDYYRQPSRETPRDPRSYRSLPVLSKEFKLVMFDASSSEWIRGEPPRHVLIDKISPKFGIKSDLNLYALLEEAFPLSEADITTIKLHFGADENGARICGSVLFASGFKAWEIVKLSMKMTNWEMRIDSGAKEFERIKLLKKPTETARIEREYEMSPRNNSYSDEKHISSSKQRDYHQSLSCSPFVPCLRIPYSCAKSLSFELTSKVIESIFPPNRFTSFSGVEEGSSTWHIHFGKEVDVVEADQMLQRDLFQWKNDTFYFERWSLMKGGQAWSIPDHYKTEESPPSTSANPVIPTVTNESSLLTESQMIIEPILSEGDIFRLPKFIKKRPHEPEPEVESVKTEGIGLKVKRKPSVVKKVFNPLPLPPQTFKEEEVEIDDNLALKSGSARTEGFFKLEGEEKMRVHFKGILEAFSSNSGIGSSNDLISGSVIESRSSRAQNRRPLTGSVTSSNQLMDFFKVSPLQSTQKLVALRNSSIHSYGLVVMEPADPGDLIIEYVGELVRASVANIREWKYEREYKGDGIASSYLFRLDGIMVIDATHQGNLARFINHSCDPNCVAKTITLNGSKRIVMYAKKPIRSGDEITYDYKFPIEKDPNKKVKCLCGSSVCRKYLN